MTTRNRRRSNLPKLLRTSPNVGLRFYFNLHRLIQSHHLHYCHERPMVLASFLHIQDDRLRNLINRYGNVDTRLVDLVPALPTSSANGMFDVVKSLVNLFRKIFWILLGCAIPTAWMCSTLDGLYTVGDIPWPDTWMRLSMRTAWL